jgi:hypothetical protein
MLRLKRFAQITDSHCGPAVIQMLLYRYGFTYSQKQIVAAARAKTRLIKEGTRPDHLARAVRVLAPAYRLYFKDLATSRDLNLLINTHKVPVAVNWQGLFYDTVLEEKKFSPFDDHGHYSIVIGFDPTKDSLVMAEPYYEYTPKPRTFKYSWFKTRWHDADPQTKPKEEFKTSFISKRLLFVVLEKDNPVVASCHLLPEKALRTRFQTIPQPKRHGFLHHFHRLFSSPRFTGAAV